MDGYFGSSHDSIVSINKGTFMKRILLSIAFLAGSCPQLSHSIIFDTTQLRESLTTVGRYMSVAATQVAMVEGSWQACKIITEKTENPLVGEGILALGLGGAVVLGKFRAGGRPLNTSALPGDTTNNVTQTNSINANGSGNTILTSSTYSPQEAVSDLGVNYLLFKLAHLSEEPSAYFFSAAIFTAKALIYHSGR